MDMIYVHGAQITDTEVCVACDVNWNDILRIGQCHLCVEGICSLSVWIENWVGIMQVVGEVVVLEFHPASCFILVGIHKLDNRLCLAIACGRDNAVRSCHGIGLSAQSRLRDAVGVFFSVKDDGQFFIACLDSSFTYIILSD